ncbi:hypothetical protein QQ045_023379 [Rhodiola kirilowii]
MDATAMFLPPGISDHSPAVVSWGCRAIKESSFRYCNFWESMDDYHDKVPSCWRSTKDCNNLFMIQAKLMMMKIMFKREFVNVAKGIDIRVENLRIALFQAQLASAQAPANIDLVHPEQNVVKEYRKVKGYQLLFYQQRAEIKWLKEGDANTKFFHSVIKGRRSKNCIKFVKCQDGSLSTEQQTIRREFVSHFKSVLANRRHCSPIRPKVVSWGRKVEESYCRSLIRDVSDIEKWNSLIKIGVNKSPRPDGYSASF